MHVVFFFQAEDGIRDLVRSRGLGDVYKRQVRAYWLAAQQGAPGAAYNLGSGEPRSIQSVLDFLLGASTRRIEVETLSLIHISEPTRPY